MALTARELEEIRDIVRRHYLALTHDATGSISLTPAELAELRRAGLITGREPVVMQNAYEFGKVAAAVGPIAARAMTVEQVRAAISKMKPLTEIERAALDFARASAGQYIKGIMDMTLKDATTSAMRASGAALRAVQEGVSEAVADRKTISELRTELFNTIENRSRDWTRIAHTELTNAIQNGIYNKIRDTSPAGADQVVFKSPNPDACKYCKALYLKPDGITPRVFKLRDLEPSNFGRRARDWKPVVGATHPWCNCQIHIIPDGYDFVTRPVVQEQFDEGGKTYKRGQRLSETEYRTLRSSHADKIGKGAILEFTGTTAAPEIMRSVLDSIPIHSVDEEEPICEC